MRVAIWNDQNEIIAMIQNGRWQIFRPEDKDILGYELFKLFIDLIQRGGGSSYGGPLHGGEDAGGDYLEAPGP
jgi:hypothetical protein